MAYSQSLAPGGLTSRNATACVHLAHAKRRVAIEIPNSAVAAIRTHEDVSIGSGRFLPQRSAYSRSGRRWSSLSLTSTRSAWMLRSMSIRGGGAEACWPEDLGGGAGAWRGTWECGGGRATLLPRGALNERRMVVLLFRGYCLVSSIPPSASAGARPPPLCDR